jgi:hypothetical protein
MPSPLVIPGVQVKTLFEPSPVLPGATGILGVVGVADRGPIVPTPIGSVSELIAAFGPATRYTMPEIRTALANGVSEVVVARIAPGKGAAARIELLDDEKESVAILRARAEGAWGNKLAVRVTQVRPASGRGIKFINLEVLYDGTTIENFSHLLMDEDSADYFFTRINEGSRVIVATDPLFDVDLPTPLAAPQGFTSADAAAATAKLTAGGQGGTQIGVTAKRPGRAGNQSVVIVRNAAPGLLLTDNADKPLLDLRRKAGPLAAGQASDISVAVDPAAPGKLTVFKAGGNPRVVTPFASTDQLLALLQNDGDLEATKLADGAPAKPAAQTALQRRIDIEVSTEGRESRIYPNIGDPAAIKNIDDPVVSFDTAAALPDTGTYPLGGGRNKGPVLALLGANSPSNAAPLLELTPASDASSDVKVSITQPAGAPGVDVAVLAGADTVESFTGLTMNPDDPNYLVDVLAQSATLRARDLFVRQHADNFPAEIRRAQKLSGGISPIPDDYGDALDRLESAEEVDLVIASVASQLDDASVRAVQELVVAHCTKMADVARNRIGLGSITAAENKDVTKILDHADSVRSDYFILAAPAGSEAALAGLLGRQDYFQSPTFKTVASVDAPLVPYTDAQLGQLVLGNVATITQKRKAGVIVVKGLLTSGRQINVQRTANKSVRDVKAIADKYIGLLNDDGTRNALRQQIIALFLQMQRDGAIVPSTDGKDPAFKVDVYSTEADFANGVVHVDIAVRPVRAIDYIYATILVEN